MLENDNVQAASVTAEPTSLPQRDQQTQATVWGALSWVRDLAF